MVWAGLACLLAIVIEAWKWPQDRSAARAKFIESQGLGESSWQLIGLVLGHSVVRWLLSLTIASTIVLAILGIPSIIASVRAAKQTHGLTPDVLDFAIGAAIAVVMCGISFAARIAAR